MSVIAAEANVSKALLHYHFTDRSHLLAGVVTMLGERLVAREQSAFEQGPAASAIDLLWRWLEVELRRGELRALLEFRTVRDATVHQALREANDARRAASSLTVSRLFARLDLTPRIATELIGDATIAFVDGLALDYERTHDTRASFDVFWLAILSLAD